MPIMIVTQKLSSLPLIPQQEKRLQFYLVREKAANLRNKLFLRLNNQFRYNNRTATRPSFKKNWFCKDCLSIFNLRPLRSRKTLMAYKLICVKCKKENVVRISRGARNFSVQELMDLAENSSIIEINFTTKTKYIPNIVDARKSLIDPSNKSYYNLS